MTYPIIIILIAFLIVCGIAATAIQQHNERKETEKREEMSRQRLIFEETEESIVAAMQMPISQSTIAVMRNRSLSCLQAIVVHNDAPDILAKIDDIEKMIKAMDMTTPSPDQNSFVLPKTDKVIIKYIQAVKKLRAILRAEYAKGNVPSTLFMQEERALASLQLRVNVETLHKRVQDALTKDMQGSARQYLEKAITALSSHKPPNDYTEFRKVELESMLNGLEMNVKDNNLQKLMAEKELESKEIESLFAPKKKW